MQILKLLYQLSELYDIQGGAMDEIFNFYIFSPRTLIFVTHIPPVTTMHAAKFHWMSLTYFFS